MEYVRRTVYSSKISSSKAANKGSIILLKLFETCEKRAQKVAKFELGILMTA
jgi:hypothetical protein